MMLNSVLEKEIWDRRRSIWWWVGGLAAMTAMMVAFYPSLEGMADFEELLDAYPDYMLAMFGIEGSDFLTAEGFIHGELYSAMLPVIILVFTILRGSSAIAGEEQQGTMDLTLSAPVSRNRVVIDEFLALAVLTVGLGLAMVVILLLGNPIVDMGLSVTGILAINLALVLFGLLFGALALAVGAWTGRKAIAAGVAAGIAVTAFFVNGLAALISWLEVPQKFSPFYWLLDSKPLSNGFEWPHLGWLALTTLLFLALAVVAFRRRDVST